MDRSSIYYRQVQLLLQVMPMVAGQECFALKGGTAINLFVRNLPRLSVDIDLVFLPLLDRSEALAAIKVALSNIAKGIKEAMADAVVTESYRNKDDALRLTVSRAGAQIKIELSPVLRGTVFEPAMMSVCDAVEEEFGFAEMRVVSHADLYAGKLCAALDRQHPRDLFDVKGLLDNEGLTDNLRKALIIYIISHHRPMAELLRPHFKDITGAYQGEFLNMTEQVIDQTVLEATRARLVELIHLQLTGQERNFLLSFKNREPNWPLLGLPSAEQLPAIRWKLKNLAAMPEDKHAQAYKKLEQVLGGKKVY